MSSGVSPVFAIVAERYRDPWDDWTGDAVPHELKHVVRLSDIAQMSPELERVISRVAPQIRIDFSKAAGVSYWLNHCSTYVRGALRRFLPGRNRRALLGDDTRGVREEGDPVYRSAGRRAAEGPLRGDESGAMEWMHHHWCRQLLSRLQGKLEHRGDAGVFSVRSQPRSTGCMVKWCTWTSGSSWRARGSTALARLFGTAMSVDPKRARGNGPVPILRPLAPLPRLDAAGSRTVTRRGGAVRGRVTRKSLPRVHATSP